MLQLSLLVIPVVYMNVFRFGLLSKIKILGNHPFSKHKKIDTYQTALYKNRF